jgi:hypothetical protein
MKRASIALNVLLLVSLIATHIQLNKALTLVKQWQEIAVESAQLRDDALYGFERCLEKLKGNRNL